mmetsp:Transcript_59560/g.153919  ORF Transcript_59560/g.153919 Transcript_59560/m.153919 type:complete len:201 (-) Transcript_59560:95-697(-)
MRFNGGVLDPLEPLRGVPRLLAAAPGDRSERVVEQLPSDGHEGRQRLGPALRLRALRLVAEARRRPEHLRLLSHVARGDAAAPDDLLRRARHPLLAGEDPGAGRRGRQRRAAAGQRAPRRWHRGGRRCHRRLPLALQLGLERGPGRAVHHRPGPRGPLGGALRVRPRGHEGRQCVREAPGLRDGGRGPAAAAPGQRHGPG